MATIVLTVAGGIFGGPLGASIGGAVGSVFDREVLFKPKGREGPRLSELRVQTSSYGTQIPKLFGTMRVAGSVIWATDLAEHRRTESGKGRPSTTSYSYTASFAVALSARPIVAVGRVWADGKLLRGAGGDMKAAGGFRLHLGHEDQAVDPLIAAAEGAGLAPAHRGTAYAVFEDLALADFGNRIPSLSFEVTADAGAPMAGAIAAALGEGVLASDGDTPALAGFSAHGASVRAVAETLAGACGGWFRDEAGRLALLRGSGEAVGIEDLGAGVGARRGARGVRAIAAADAAPKLVTLTHYDPARDHQAGVQRASRPGPGTREARLELPAALYAGAAKTIAEAALARLDLERERRMVALSWSALTVRPGERVTIAGAPGQWRVAQWMLENMVLTLECVPITDGTLAAAASGGRVLPAPDVALGATVIHAFELPPLDGTLASVPQLAVAAAGTAPGWRGAALSLSTDGGASWSPLGATAAPAVLGTIAVPPGAGPARLADEVNTLEVELANAGMMLGDADRASLEGGANLAMAGDELLQFARAEPLGGTAWRLSGLWRGRRGTEAAIGTQAVGGRFVLITTESLMTAALPMAAIGGDIRVLAQGAGDGTGAAESQFQPSGVSLAPPTPVHLTARRMADGTTELRWVRRSRAAWEWSDGIDAPLTEERERYRVSIMPEGASDRIQDTLTPVLLLSGIDRATATAVQVRQIGSHALSGPAAILLPPLGEDE